MTVIDISIFILYLVGIVLFGSSFYRKNKTSSAFTLGNNTLPGYAAWLGDYPVHPGYLCKQH